MEENIMEMFYVAVLFLVVPAVILLMTSFFVVEQQSTAIIERFGKFIRIATPGLNIKIPFVERISGMVNLRINQLDLIVETKTLDNVFVQIMTSVQYRILTGKVYEAFYILQKPEAQIQAFVFDVVRARVPAIKLDDVFSRKDDIANAIRDELKEVMTEFGYDIMKALVTDVNPDAKVKSAMNEINEAQRLRMAAMERGEAEKILKVKQAEAEAESKILQGRGLAGQRRAIIDGLKDALTDFQSSVQDARTNDVMSLMLMTQYFDTLKELGLHSKTNTILIPHSPSTSQEMYQQLSNSVITGLQIGDRVGDSLEEGKGKKK
jgi:regulator of protease activity HflC (stomatin/prohibitin superfamily)